uniref:Pentacotripeptide-repeat region of PRORP domain-containing protein n=1 Tax=Alexandrium catenella TaxID=2925 RepID=A0A7S1RX69_ALECA
MDRARKLVREMKQANGLVDIITYNTLMKGYCQGGNLKSARELLVEMKEAGHPPNDVTYNCLVNAAVSHGNGNFREAWETIELMEASGVAADHYTISIMMKALKRVKNPRDVARALELLDRSAIDICSDEILLNSVLETCIRHREMRRIEGVLASYQGSSLKPQVHTYGSLIKACSTLKRVDKCWAFWREMEEHRGIQPNDIVLGCMLDALVCNGCVDDAVEVFSKWKKHLKPNTVIYSTLIKGFANTHQADRAMAAWKEMRATGIQMNTVVYNAVIDAQARIGAINEVSELVQAMEPDGCMPDVITYSTIVKGYCVKGDLDKAFEVFRGMRKNNMAGDSIIYNTVLDGCTRHGRFDLADGLLADMERFKVIPSNFTLGILVKMYGRRRQLDKAFEVVDSFPRRFGFSANAQVSTCLMCACLNNGSTERAFQVFDDLKRSSKGADTKAYSALISGCIRHNQLHKARQLVEEAYGLSGGKPCPGAAQETEPVEQLLKAYSQRGLMEQQGVPLLESLRIAKVPINGRVFGSTFGGRSSGGGGGQRNGGRPWRGSNY